MKILITGINGFAASQLARHLLERVGVFPDIKNIEVHGTVRLRSDLHRLKMLKLYDVPVHTCDITDSHRVLEVIDDIKPDQIYHLAAQNYVKYSWEAPHETYNTNVIGTIHLLESVRRIVPDCSVLITSSSEIYGYHDSLIHEGTVPSPRNPYAISKYTQDMLARNYANAYKMRIIVTRAFNVTGWGRGEMFVDSNFAKQLVEIEKGAKSAEINHGNLEAKRCFIDIQDVIKGYVLAMEKGKAGEVYCLGHEESTSIQDLLEELIVQSGLFVKLIPDPTRIRPTDTPDMRCSPLYAMKQLGWKGKTVPLTKSLRDLLNYWEARLGNA